jgi:hypothetical protein
MVWIQQILPSYVVVSKTRAFTDHDIVLSMFMLVSIFLWERVVILPFLINVAIYKHNGLILYSLFNVFNNTRVFERDSDFCLTPTRHFLQLYHDENKSIFNEMMLNSAL